MSQGKKNRPVNHNPSPQATNAIAVVDDDAVASGGELLDKMEGVVVTDDPISDTKKASLTGFLRPPVEMLKLIVAAYEKHPELFGGSFDVDSVKNAIAYSEAYAPLITQSREIANRMSEQVFTRRAAAGEACLNAYQAMRGVSRMPKGALLKPVVKQIAALLKRKKAPVEPAPVEAPAPTEAQK